MKVVQRDNLVKMGQHNSAPKQRRLSIRSPFVRRSHRSNYSLTFSRTDEDQPVEQININNATEEELMTLPDISRATAQCIVNYRRLIGRFKKVEDLALVSGIGAEKFERIRPEVCVRNISGSNSRAQSIDSLKSIESRIVRLVDINSAGVFDLHSVPGMTQEMAANIVHYRYKRGLFKHLEDLTKVKSISHMQLSNFRHHLTLNTGDYDRDSLLSRTTSVSETFSNGTAVAMNGGTSSTLSTPTRHRKSSSAPVRLQIANGLPSPSSLGDIFELLSAYSYRPIPEEEFNHTRNGRDAFRIATWNLHQFTVDKAQNPGVREVICRTILENCWSIVCLQEVYDETALQIICDELNTPRLRKVAEWRRNSKNWDCEVLSNNLGFIYECSVGRLNVEVISLTEHNVDNIYSAVTAEFSIGEDVTNGNGCVSPLRLLNVHINEDTPTTTVADTLHDVNGNEHLFVLGDLSRLSNNSNGNGNITSVAGLQAVLPLHTNTACAHVTDRYSSNILVSGGMRGQLTGEWGTVRKGLTHLSIPNGWSWGGTVSPHCPIWSEVYVSKNAAVTISNGL